jgi:hypothetical protein
MAGIIGPRSGPSTAKAASPPAAAFACIERRSTSRTVVAGQSLGLKEVADAIWVVTFMAYDLGYIDLERKNLATYRQPVRVPGVTHVLGTFRYLCVRAGQKPNWLRG